MRMLPLLLGPLLSLLAVTVASSADAAAERVPLWDGQAPTGDGGSEPAPADATLTIHRAEHGNGAALIICPGGGYGTRVSGPEGHGIAAWLNAHGITGCVLDYRLPKGRAAVPLLDAQRAIRLVRARAQELGVDPKRIGIIGFSAGGHLAATAATLSDPGVPTAADPLQRLSDRPDFAILVYPVVSMRDPLAHGGSRDNLLGKGAGAELMQRYSAELHVDHNTPPVYLAHAKDDTLVSIENSRVFAKALADHHIAAELLELPSGGHGLNGYQGPMWNAWQDGSLAWLAAQHVIPAADAAAKH